MMLSMVFTVLLALFNKLPALETPDLFEQFGLALSAAVDFFNAGMELCITVMGASAVRYIGIYLGIVILLDSFYLAYQMVWWFITKIPMLGIKQ